MKMDTQILFLIAIIGIIAAGVVGASVVNNDSTKQLDFDGIKVTVPSDADFVKTSDGYVDSRYGITVHTFKDNNSMVSYLTSVGEAKVVSLQNQPPQSVAFTKGDETNILVTNGGEGICIGAQDQDLTIEMANSIVFSNHQKSEKPHGVLGMNPPHLEFHRDFNMMMLLLGKVNTVNFNPEIYEGNITYVIDDYNNAVNEGVIDDYTSPDNGTVAFDENTTTALIDSPEASNLVDSINSESNVLGSSASDSVASDDGGVPAAGGDADSGSEYDQSYFEQYVKEMIQGIDGATIDHVDDSGNKYIFYIEANGEDIGTIECDKTSGDVQDHLNIPSDNQEDMM